MAEESAGRCHHQITESERSEIEGSEEGTGGRESSYPSSGSQAIHHAAEALFISQAIHHAVVTNALYVIMIGDYALELKGINCLRKEIDQILLPVFKSCIHSKL